MNIPPHIILMFAAVVFALFVVVFIVATLLTFRNRRTLRRASTKRVNH